MNSDQTFFSKYRLETLLFISLIPLLIKSLNYLMIEGFTPLFVFILFGGILLPALVRNFKYKYLIIKIWSYAIILWGIVRITIMILFLSTSVQEAHIESQFGVWFVLLSSVHVIAGVYFFKSARKMAT